MDVENINREYLETLSYAGLVKLADEYGVDVPEDLDRRFLLCELLEIIEETKRYEETSMVISSEESNSREDALPKGYNETQISCILRNPVWAFVFWDISESDTAMLRSLSDCRLFIRVCSLPSATEFTPEEVFEIEADSNVTEQYVLIPAGKRFIRVELIYVNGTNREILAFSPVVEIPKSSDFVDNFQPGINNDFPEVIKLSGIEKILTEQYKNHRHSFS